VEFRAVLFDLGGTLFSYTGRRGMGDVVLKTARSIGLEGKARDIGLAWREASQTVTQEFSSRDYFLHRDLFIETLRAFASGFGVSVPTAVADQFHTLQRAAVVDHLPIRDDCLDTLRALKARGLYLSIVSNIDDDYLDPLVEKHGLDQVLDHWTSSEEARSCKPDPRIYHYALKKAGISAGEALFVGDSLQHDVAGAHKAGLRSARIVEEGIVTPLTGGLEVTAQPDYEIGALSDLLHIVDSAKAESASAGAED
jgi:2-haloalkanoic acid dehalogenase type II